MSFRVPKLAPVLTMALYGLLLVGLALVVAARVLDPGPLVVLAGVACWIAAAGILLSYAGPHGRR